jgi:hypothetical protein
MGSEIAVAQTNVDLGVMRCFLASITIHGLGHLIRTRSSNGPWLPSESIAGRNPWIPDLG